MGREELDRLIDGHLQQVIDARPFEQHIQHLLLEPLAVAAVAREGDVGHELHLDRDLSLSLALFATASLLVEGEIGRLEAHLFGQRLVGI